jgi:hypothetical protein
MKIDFEKSRLEKDLYTSFIKKNCICFFNEINIFILL